MFRRGGGSLPSYAAPSTASKAPEPLLHFTDSLGGVEPPLGDKLVDGVLAAKDALVAVDSVGEGGDDGAGGDQEAIEDGVGGGDSWEQHGDGGVESDGLHDYGVEVWVLDGGVEGERGLQRFLDIRALRKSVLQERERIRGGV